MMLNRLRVALLPTIVLGLLILLQAPSQRADPAPNPNSGSPRHPVPIVAIRGQPLAEHEEPLPAGARVRIGSTRFRHPTDLGESNNQAAGEYIVTTRGQSITLTDRHTGRRVWTEHVKNIGRRWGFVSCTVSPDGKRLVVWGENDAGLPAARLYEVHAKPDRPLQAVASLHPPFAEGFYFFDSFVFSSDSSVMTYFAHSTLTRYDAATGQQLTSIKTEGTILESAGDGSRFLKVFGSDPRLAGFIVCGNHSVPRYRFRAPESQSAPSRLSWPAQFDESPIQQDVSFLQLAICNGLDGQAECTLNIPRVEHESVHPLALSRDGTHVVYRFRNRIYVWSVAQQEQALEIGPTWSWKGLGRRRIVDAQFSDDGQSLLVDESNGTTRHFDLATRTEVAATAPTQRSPRRPRADLVSDHGIILPAAGKTPPPGYARIVMDVTPDGQLIAVGDATGRVDLWRSNGKIVRSFDAREYEIVALSFSPDGQRLAACDKRRQMRVWNIATGNESERIDIPADLPDHPDLYPRHLTFSPDGRRILVSRDDIMALWDLGTRQWLWDHAGTLEHQYDFNGRRVSSTPVFSLDGKLILTDDLACWLDATTGEPAPSHGVARTGRREHGQILAVSPDQELCVIDAETSFNVCAARFGEPTRAVPESKHIGFERVRFSPDCRRLVTSNSASQAHVWEVATGQLAYTLNYPGGDIDNIYFTRDGRSLITCNHREVIVWDPASERPLGDPWDSLGHDAPEAEQVRRALVAEPALAIETLRARLQPEKGLDPAEVHRHIRALEQGNFRAREQAMTALIGCGSRVLPYLKEATLASAEGRARLASLVRTLQCGLTPNELRQVRSIEILEQIDAPAAQKIIDALARGDPTAVSTIAAKKSLAMRNVAPRHLAKSRP